MGCIGRARDSLPRFSTFERPPREANDARPRETDSNSHEWRPPSGTSYATIETRRKLARVYSRGSWPMRATDTRIASVTIECFLTKFQKFSSAAYFPPNISIDSFFFLLENYRYECFFIGFLIGLIKRVKERNNRLRISNIFSITIRKKNILILNLHYILWYLIIELKLHLIIEFTFESNKNSDNERWSLWTKFSKLSDWLLK